MQKTIVEREYDPANISALSTLPPILQRIYAARGVSEQQQLTHGLSQLLPYHSLLNIQATAQYLATAIQQQKRISIIGDFDADGATSVAVALSALRSFGAKHIDYLVPNRFDFGYGLTPEIVEVAAQTQQAEIIITVDNGIANHAGVARANALGIEVIITDHHLAASTLPEAKFIINPNQPGDEFPSKHLAGVGVIYYVMLAVRSELREQGWFIFEDIRMPNMAQLLDLVALGTVADVVPLDHNNRILVHQGLQRMRAGKTRPGILALLQVAGRDRQQLVASDLGFAVGPRLNAAGRLQDMRVGIECLLAKDFARAMDLAKQLDELNRERREIETEMQQQVFAEFKQLPLHQQENLPIGICLYDATWHQGVIGILAARVKEKWHRPVIAFAKMSENELKGSARSIPGLHIRDALEQIDVCYPGLMLKFGGHAMAAGVLPFRQKTILNFKQHFRK
jgi:single-stranded-DNA-specific exonuclease